MNRLIHLDAAASTPLAPEVLDVMLPVLRDHAGNPSSSHWAGRRAAALVEHAREQVASLTGRDSAGVTFLSGATEANNLVLHGLLDSTANPGRRGVVSCVTEHPAVLEPLTAWAERGVPVHLVGVDRHGRVDLDELERTVGDTTMLVTVMAANNETGVLADLDALARIAHAAGALLHTDASQLLAWGPLPADHDVDLITVSGHKMHGPQGVGALVADPSVARQLRPLQRGGGQERGVRSGTVNVAGVVGLGAAAHLAQQMDGDAAARVRDLRDGLHAHLLAELPVAALNGHPEHRLPGTLNIAVGDTGDEVDADAVLANMPAIAASSGSACSSGAPGPSGVLLAMGLSTERARSSLRLSLSRLTEAKDVTDAAPQVVSAVRQVRGYRDPVRIPSREGELVHSA